MEIARQMISLVLVFSLLAAALWVLRRGGAATFRARWWRRPRRDKTIEPMERLALTPQHALHLVRIDGRVLVVATYPQGCALLTETRQGVGA